MFDKRWRPPFDGHFLAHLDSLRDAHGFSTSSFWFDQFSRRSTTNHGSRPFGSTVDFVRKRESRFLLWFSLVGTLQRSLSFRFVGQSSELSIFDRNFPSNCSSPIAVRENDRKPRESTSLRFCSFGRSKFDENFRFDDSDRLF